MCHPLPQAAPVFDKNQLMPLIPEEPQIHESAQGPSATPASSRVAPTPALFPVPAPRLRRVPVVPAPCGRRRRRNVRRVTWPWPSPPSGPAVPASSDAAVATPQIQLIPASAEGALDAAEEAVDLLLESGRAPVTCW